jgi:NAD(P)H-dependent FMN reductase
MKSEIVCISGTSRPDNYTFRAVSVVARTLRDAGQAVTVLDGRELELTFPGKPDTPDTLRLRETIERAQAVLLATPEYHGGFSAFTKLIIESLGFPSELGGKPLALLGVADGRLRAVKSLEQLRGVCAHVGAIVLPRSLSIAGVSRAFDDEGRCLDPFIQEALEGHAHSLLRFIDEYVRPRHVLEEMVREGGDGQAPWAASV